MRAFIIVVFQPFVQISLQLFYRPVDFPAQRRLIKLLQYGLVEPLADTIGLRVAHLSSRVLNVIDRQIQLIIMALSFAAVFSTSVGQYA